MELLRGNAEAHEEAGAPEFIQAVPRFVYDLEALEVHTEMDCPPCVRVRPVAMACTGFTFGDTCRVGFGQSLWLLGADDIDVFYGLWGDAAIDNSSNWKEFYKQVMGVKRGLNKGTIPWGTELFMFTDNFMMERAYFWGTSKSKALFDLVLRLHKLEMCGDLHIHLIWVART